MTAKTTATLNDTTTIRAENAPIGVQLWPTSSPRYAPNFTLAEVLIRRTAVSTWVEWIYCNGKTRKFDYGTDVAIQLPR